jgi:hypothetical protein
MKYQVTLSADKTSPPLAKKKLRQTTKRRYIQSLRLQPCAVFKISQRAVVYSTKAYELGLIDFALHALSERQEMNRIHQQILAGYVNTPMKCLRVLLSCPSMPFTNGRRIS